MDITGDGIEDIVSGEYGGKITLYKGSKDGFEAPVEITQTTDIKNNSVFYTFLFTNPSLGDFNDDGLLDALIGGAKGMRVMLNEGTKETPSFGDREKLLDVDGVQIGPKVFTEKELEDFKKYEGGKSGMTTSDFKTYVYLLDWDNDGVKDIISTSSYYGYPTPVNAINFHKGVKTKDGLRFEELVPLFVAEDGGKALPGTILIPFFQDINGDGALDILMGVSVECKDKVIQDPCLMVDGKTIVVNKKNRLKSNGFVMVFLSDKKYK